MQECTGGGSLTDAGWTDDQGDGGDSCVDQAIKDYCSVFDVPEAVDPSDASTSTGTVWNAPAVLIDSGVEAQISAPLAVLKGHMEQSSAPEGLLQEFSDDIRMGATTINYN